MSHPPPSFNADHYNQGRWHDGNIDQGRPANPPAPFWSVSATNIPHNQPDAAYYRHHGGGPGAWPGSTLIVDNALVWPSGHPGQQAYASHPHIKDGHGVHNAQYRDNDDRHYMHNSTPEVTETYGHNGDIVASPIHEHQYQYPAYGQYASAEYPRGWATDSPMSTQMASTDVPDEYRASIARHCDAIHASGSHGLESDNNVAPVRTYPSRLPREEKVEPDQPRGRKVWNSEIAAAAYHSLVGHPPPHHVMAAPVKVEEPLMDAPMQIPSQQYLVDYMHVQLPIGQGPRSPVAQYQPTQASPTTSRRSSTPPSDGPDYVVPANLSHKKAVRPAMSTLISSRQGLEHEAAGDSEPNVKLESQQQPSSPTPFPGSSQSVLKLTTTKKVAEKKQALACLFCRERKIACGRPDADNEDQTCNQCARRHIVCEYPKESRRGQHKRTRRKKTHDHDVNEASPHSGH